MCNGKGVYVWEGGREAVRSGLDGMEVVIASVVLGGVGCGVSWLGRYRVGGKWVVEVRGRGEVDGRRLIGGRGEVEGCVYWYMEIYRDIYR